MTAQPTPSPVTFPLSADFAYEIGWSDAVQEATTTNPAVIRHLALHAGELPVGDDPPTLLGQWWPSAGYMMYFVRRRPGCDRCELAVSDGVFTFSIPSDERAQFNGLAGFLLGRAQAAWTAKGPSLPFPLLPPETGLPEAVIIHHLAKAEATFGSYEPMRQALQKKDPL